LVTFGPAAARTHIQFGVKGEYGAPRDLDGMVPQVYATWVNGLTPGRYYARGWIFRYVQSALDGSTFQEYYFDVTPNEWAGDVTLPIDLRLSSWVNKTVHFHDELGGLVEDPINTGAGFMTGWLLGVDGNVYSYNQTALGLICLSPTNPTQLCRQAGTPQIPFGVPLYPKKGGGGGWSVTIPMYGGPGTGENGVDAAGSGASPGSGINLDPGFVNGNAAHRSGYLAKSTLFRELGRAAQGLVLLVGFIVVARITGLASEVEELTVLGLLGLGFTLYVQNVVNEAVNAFILIQRNLLRENDQVMIRDVKGRVVRITARHTYIRTDEGDVVIVGNSFLARGPLVNYTAKERLKNEEWFTGKYDMAS
jgi:hypothetical protein